jgi:D-cysteine desulfhydrase
MTGLLSRPRLPLAVTPTPLQPAPRLSEAIGVEVWLKRDDLTGLGLGGNKVRGLEYLLADALARDADCLVTGAGPQSNWAMLAALGARRCGLDAFLAFYGQPVPPAGNLLLGELIGAEVTFTGDPERSSVDAAIETVAQRLRSVGRRPYVLPRGGATVLGAAGYARASLELAEQLVAANLAPAQLWLPTGSCGTQAGLVAGARWLGLPYEVVGVTVSRSPAECREIVGRLAAGLGEMLSPGFPAPEEADITVLDGYLGPGYGRPSAEGDAATALVARTEGIFLDPVFGAKAMAALLDGARSGRLSAPSVFLVTGGAPTLFAVGSP